MIKHLKSQFESWEGHSVVPVNLNLLWQSVPIAETHSGKQFFDPLKRSLETDGMKFPILVVKCTYQQLKQQKERHGKRILDLPEEDPDKLHYYAVWGGSNRFVAAQQLGYDSIDCVVIPDGNFNLAFNYQNKHRNGSPKFN